MSFKKFNEMELLMLASIANMTTEDAEGISIEKGDYTSVTVEDCTSMENYLRKPNTIRHAQRRKATFNKKKSRKELVRDLGYDMSAMSTNKKVKSMLSANHSDKSYFRGSKAERKRMSVKEEVFLMEQESVEEARESMMEKYNSILGSIIEDIDTLTLDMKCNDYSIENLKMEYKELEEAMKVVSEKLQNAKMKRNGIMAAKLQKENELDAMSAKLRRERISRFGW